MSKGLKAWVVESNYRMKIKSALHKSSDTELLILKDELLKELKKRSQK